MRSRTIINNSVLTIGRNSYQVPGAVFAGRVGYFDPADLMKKAQSVYEEDESEAAYTLMMKSRTIRILYDLMKKVQPIYEEEEAGAAYT